MDFIWVQGIESRFTGLGSVGNAFENLDRPSRAHLQFSRHRKITEVEGLGVRGKKSQSVFFSWGSWLSRQTGADIQILMVLQLWRMHRAATTP
jgi:hypothetical protein